MSMKKLIVAELMALFFICAAQHANAQIYVAENFGPVLEYGLDGRPINTPLITGLSANALAESGGILYVGNYLFFGQHGC